MPIRDTLSRPAGRARLLGLALLLTALWPASAARAQRDDPVTELNLALLRTLPGETDPQALEKQAAELTELTNDKSRLRTLSQMSRALLLSNWSDYQTEPDRPTVLTPASKVNHDVRLALVHRFLAEARKAIAVGDQKHLPALRAAVATQVGELAASTRWGIIDVADRNKLLIDNLAKLADPLAGLAKSDSSPEVRMVAARALVRVRAAPDLTLGGLEAMLKDDRVAVRRAAASALGDLLRGPQADDRMTLTAWVPESRYLSAFGPGVARAAGPVLAGRESDAEVRRLCADALTYLGTSLNTIHADLATLPDLRRELRPATTALWEQTAALTKGTDDPDPEVRHASLGALDQMSLLRARWLRPERFDVVPPREIVPFPAPKPLRVGEAEAPEESGGVRLTAEAEQAPAKEGDPLPMGEAVPALLRGLRDASVRNRLLAADALESVTVHPEEQTVAQALGAGPAAAAARGLERALHDPDRFVRWAAARALGRMAPLTGVSDAREVERGAVTGLASLLSDADPDVRLATARALEQYGDAARAAVPALVRAANRGDLDARLAVMHAIQVIGGSPEEAVPALAAGLSDRNVRARRGAAEALTKYGARAVAARPALERALRDSDPEVRRLASEALVNVGAGE